MASQPTTGSASSSSGTSRGGLAALHTQQDGYLKRLEESINKLTENFGKILESAKVSYANRIINIRIVWNDLMPIFRITIILYLSISLDQ